MQNIIALFTFFFINILAISSSFLLVYRIFRITRLLDFLIASLLLYFSQIILTLLSLGVLNFLYLQNVILLNLAIFGVIWILGHIKKPSSSFILYQKLALELPLTNKTFLLLVSVITAFGLSKLLINLINPPFGWDSLNYHFTFAVEWLKNANLNMPPVVFDDPSPSYYPINGSLIYLWLMLALKNVCFADLGQAPFFILACLAVYGISRKLGQNKEYAFYSTALFLLIPNFFKQLQVAYVDVMVAGLFLACIYLLFLLKDEFSWQNMTLFSLSLGLGLGTKTIALPYSLILLVPFLYLYFKNYRKIGFILIFLFSVFILGGFSYLRNFLETGNPLYPLNFKLFGKAIFSGVMDKAVYKAHFKAEDYALSKMLFHEGLGLQTLIFVLPAVFLGLPVVFLRKRKVDFMLFYLFAMPLIIYAIYYYVIPLANLRYIYPLLGLGMVIGFLIINDLNIWPNFVKIAVAICVLASASELAKRQELVTGIILTILLFIFLSSIILFLAKFKNRKPIIAGFCLAVLISLIFINSYYDKNEFIRYRKMQKYSGFWPDAISAWAWMNNNTTGKNIAYAGRPVPFPLYGTHFKNNVYYVSVNKTDPLQLHYFPNARYKWGYDFLSLHRNLEEKGNYRENPDINIWLGNLFKRNIDYLFVYSLHQIKGIEFPVEDNWALADPVRFKPVFSNATIHIYKINK